MFLQLFKQLKCLAQSRRYWLFFITAGMTLLAVALYFQHGLNEQPCVVCIQIRLWISLLVIVSVIGLLSRNNRLINTLCHSSVVLIAIGLVERCYLLLGTERGFVFADCGFSLGLPAWFAIEEWLPWLYRIETSCGYTPELAFGITMAEALIVISISLILVSICVTLAAFINLKDRQ